MHSSIKTKTCSFNAILAKRGLNGFDPDCEVDGLEYALNHINMERSKIIWNLMKKHSARIYGVVESSSRQNYTGSEMEEQASKMGMLVREKEWLPDKSGVFHRPSDILLSQLPDDFDKRDAEILSDRLGLKKDVEGRFFAR